MSSHDLLITRGGGDKIAPPSKASPLLFEEHLTPICGLDLGQERSIGNRRIVSHFRWSRQRRGWAIGKPGWREILAQPTSRADPRYLGRFLEWLKHEIKS
ncbi:hypothetical protein [Rhodopseudomonas palustris]|uniref:hypothetical protein n=1 Tax=Rhodopseudomonas palustris TaxID=1076 RepID=UPI00069BD92A|nr:hypothetical protein [Rhodopseudomonas palustris]